MTEIRHILLAVSDRDVSPLQAVLRSLAPGRTQVYTLADHFDPAIVDFAVLWKQPPGLLARMKKLKAVTSLGAGVDFILSDPGLPPNVPVARIVAADLKQQMAQYVTAVVTRFHRRFPEFECQQKNRQWRVLPVSPSPVVGFAGFGQLAAYCADALRLLGYQIASWTRVSDTNAEWSYKGDAQWPQFLRASDFVVNLLPLTDATCGLFDHTAFTHMAAKRPVFLHLGRGPQVAENDLLCALDEDQLRHAVMDVFNTEPLPVDSPLWHHPKITITPHLAARSDARQTAEAIVAQLQALRDGRTLPLQVDRRRAY